MVCPQHSGLSVAIDIMTVEDDILKNRTLELENVLQFVSSKLINYSAQLDSVGSLITPQKLAANVDIQLPENGTGFDGLKKNTELLLKYSTATWHPGFLDKLYAATNPVGVASDLILSILNTNSHVFTVSPLLTLIEKETSKRYAGLFGFNGPHAGGLTFPGGSYSNSTSMQIARSLKFPQTREHGNFNLKLAVFCSRHAHYSVKKAAIFCGLGTSSVFSVDVDKKGQMVPSHLDHVINEASKSGYTPFYINATAGTTVLGSFDPLVAIADIADKYDCWLHVDGSWGANVVFSNVQKSKLDGVSRARSLTVNPHKMLGVPTTCSFLLMPDTREMQKANSLDAPYLFHQNGEQEESFDLADSTMGCGRRPDALKLYLAWQWYGTKGLGDRIDHAFAVTEYLAKTVLNDKRFTLISEYPPPCLQTCFKCNDGDTKAIVEELQRRGQFLIDYAPDENGVPFFRVVINAPVVTNSTVDDLLSAIIDIAEK